MDLRVVSTITTTEPVTRDEVKTYLRINNSQDDTLIDNIIVNARAQAERYLKRDILSKNRELYLDEVNESIHLPYAPISFTRNSSGTLTNFTVEVDGEDQVEDEGFEILGLDNPKIRIGVLSDAFRISGARSRYEAIPARKVKITYTTAGLDASEFEQGILALCAWLYYGRNAEMPTNWKSWLHPFRIHNYYGTR